MIGELWGEYGRNLLVAVIGVGLALICLVGILWIVRGRRGPSPFVRGGRNRQPRLQVLDAAAVDTRRRLVLVRRDDVEHLIMIGGPTDVVIESRIATSAKSVEARTDETYPAQQAAVQSSAAKLPASETARSIPQQAAASRAELAKEPSPEIFTRETRVQATTQPAAIAIKPTTTTRAEPTPAPASPARPEPAQPQVRVDTAATRQPTLDDAARLLDSQRDRVFAERSVPPPSPAPIPASRPNPVPADRPTGLGSDFEKILEEEMANNMAARDASIAGRANRTLPQAGPVVAIPAAAAPGATRDDPSLQSEVARIFGEMSASRDK